MPVGKGSLSRVATKLAIKEGEVSPNKPPEVTIKVEVNSAQAKAIKQPKPKTPTKTTNKNIYQLYDELPYYLL